MSSSMSTIVVTMGAGAETGGISPLVLRPWSLIPCTPSGLGRGLTGNTGHVSIGLSESLGAVG